MKIRLSELKSSSTIKHECKKDFEKFSNYMDKYGSERCRKVGNAMKGVGIALGSLFVVGFTVTAIGLTGGLAFVPIVVVAVGLLSATSFFTGRSLTGEAKEQKSVMTESMNKISRSMDQCHSNLS